jgi:hypothetical protein
VTPSDPLISAQEGTPEVLDELAFHEIDQLAETEQFNNQVLQYYQAQAKGRRSTHILEIRPTRQRSGYNDAGSRNSSKSSRP